MRGPERNGELVQQLKRAACVSAARRLASGCVGLIPPETIELIAAANDIVEVIGSYFPLKRAGSSFRALCPFHQEKSPSFHVNPTRQSFHCFGCGAGGSVFRFVMNYENVDFPAAAKRLAERAGIQIVESELSAADDQRFRMRKRLLALHAAAAEWFHQNLLKSLEAKAARSYLKGRGIGSEIAKSWKIGYAPEAWEALGEWARAEGFSAEELIASGLVKEKEKERTPNAERRTPETEENPKSKIQTPKYYDRFRDRVMFPICNDLGEVIAFSGRVLQSDAQTAKYVNSPETMLFTKGHVLFGLQKSKRALADKGAAIVLEGQLDLIAAFEAGVQNVVASQGTAFTEKQARTLKRFADEVVLCFDADSAGAKATERSLAALLDANLIVRVAAMPAGHDPDSLIREQGAEAFVRQIAAARDFFDFQIDKHAHTEEFATPRGKMQFAKKMAESVGLITDAVLRESVANKVAMRLQISLRDFWALLGKNAKAAAAPAQQKARPLYSDSVTGQLSLLALRDALARSWILDQPWQELLGGIAEAELLVKILEANLRPAETASLHAFSSGLKPEEEMAINALLAEKLPKGPSAAAQDCWRKLERNALERRYQALLARQRTPNLSTEETINLSKQILDLQKSFTDIARPFS